MFIYTKLLTVPEKDIEELLNLPILGQVSRMSDTYLGLSETVKTRRAVRREG